MIRFTATLVTLAALWTVSIALPKFVRELPNGGAGSDPDTGISCEHLGHDQCNPSAPDAPRNQFGLDFDAAGRKWTKELCERDSDGDGQSNGQELGDPCCQWAPGKDEILRTTQLSHPALAESKNDAEPISCATTTPATSPEPPLPPMTATPEASSEASPSDPSAGTPEATPAAPSPFEPSTDTPEVTSETSPTVPPSGTPAAPPSPVESPKPSPLSPEESLESSPSETSSPAPGATDPSTNPQATPEPTQLGSPPSGTSPAPAPDNNRVCFPAHARVTLEDGRHVAMADLKIGDRVQVADATFSDIFMFTHRLPHVRHVFVRLHAGNTVLTVTKSHFVHMFDDGLRQAGNVRVGDKLLLVSGAGAVVHHMDEVMGDGLYNPQTLHGDIVVEGVVSSTYTAAVHRGAAHSLLAPLRAVFRLLGMSTARLEGGAAKICPEPHPYCL